jgi:LysR family transcriptional activator of mexEF-oprN operon
MPNINENYVRDFDLNLLRVFVVVAEEGSLTRAASRLYVTQPAISASIKRLTTFVGAELFTRQGHGLVLTARGTTLLEVARLHLRQLVAAALDVPAFEPAQSSATVRIGLSGFLEAVLLPQLLERLRKRAPRLQLVVLRVHFHTIEEMLLSGKVDIAVGVVDELPRSIRRREIGPSDITGHHYVCLYDPRFVSLPRRLTEKAYFAREHVVVSYAGDARGIIEDTTGKMRKVRLSVPAFSYVPDVVDGSDLVATVPNLYAMHILRTRPHLHTLPLPFELPRSKLEMLWSRVTEDDAPSRFIREITIEIAATMRVGRSPKQKRVGR